MRILTTTALLLAMAGPAAAETQLERMERLTEALQTKLFEALEKDTGADLDIETMVSWDDEMREAGQCVLDRYGEQISPEDMDVTFNEMQTLLDTPTDGFNQMTEQMRQLTAPVPQDLAIEINQQCGMVALQQERIKESGLADALRKSRGPQ